MLARNQSRMFSAAGYQAVSHDKWYTPENKVTFSGKELTVFSGDDVKEKRYVPWLIKEASFKNGMGILGTHMLSMWIPLGNIYQLS